MPNRDCNLTKRVRTNHGLRFCPVVLSANGRIKPDWAIVNGNEERHSEGAYYIEWREGAKRIRESVGKDAADANARRLRKEAELNAKNNGVAIADEGPNSKRRLIASAVAEYLDEIKITRCEATHSAYELALRNFTESCSKVNLEEIDRSDLLHYLKHLRDKELSDRTCHNRFEHLLTFLKAFGIEKLAKKRDWPKYVTQEPESYEDDDLEKFFGACDPEEKIFFEFHLMTGFRKKEVTFCTWPDVDLRACVVRVTAKPENGFRPKDWEEREVPIPDRLAQSLKGWATQHRNGSEFVFPTRNGRPRKHRTQLLELCYDSEADLESAILQVQDRLFGAKRFYLDVKSKIGVKGSTQNIPDGYLLDLSTARPRLWVVENELQAHDPLRHIAVQILQFSLSFESERFGVKKILVRALQSRPDLRKVCEEYASSREFRNFDHLLEHLVESPFSALVIIDSMPENLETVLSKKFNFGVEVLELARYESEDGERAYHFEPFLEEIVGEAVVTERSAQPPLRADEIDTIVVPAKADGFQETFMGENRWYEVRIHGSVRPQIKYIAVYQITPVQAITHFAQVKSIEPWKDSGKFVLNFAEPAKSIGPIPLLEHGRVQGLRSPRYTTHDRLLRARNLDQVFSSAESEKVARAAHLE